MLYTEYEEYKTKYLNAQKEYDKILNEKEKLFGITQPKATEFDKERVNGGSPVNSFDKYMENMEKKQIDERLNVARSILEDREKLLKLKENELRSSKDWLDRIYVYYYLEKLSIRKIEKKIKYKYDYPISKSEIDRKLQKISKNINFGTKGDKKHGNIVL